LQRGWFGSFLQSGGDSADCDGVPLVCVVAFAAFGAAVLLLPVDPPVAQPAPASAVRNTARSGGAILLERVEVRMVVVFLSW